MAWRWPWAPGPGRGSARAEGRAGETKEATGFVALHVAGEARWTRRDFATLAREGYMRNAVVYRSVRLVAETAAAVPWLLYEGTAELTEHPLLELLARPNPRQAGATFMEALYGHLLLAGNAYLELTGAGAAHELHLLRPDRVRVVTDAAGWPSALEYREGQAKRLVPLDFGPAEGSARGLQLCLFHPLDDHYGFPALEAALAALDIHNAASRWNKALLDNSARPSGALVYAPILPRGRREAAARFAVGVVCGLVFGGTAGLKIATELGIGQRLSAGETVLMGSAAASLCAWWALGFLARSFEWGGGALIRWPRRKGGPADEG